MSSALKNKHLWRLAFLSIITLVMVASLLTRQFASANELPGSAHCLSAGTLVSTENGPRAIETLVAGDLVWTEDEAQRQVELQAVTELSQQISSTLQLSFSNNESVQTTAGHQFYVEGDGFKAADQLAVGDALVTKSGPSLTITAIGAQSPQQTVYGLSLAQFGTYFVGGSELWVRN